MSSFNSVPLGRSVRKQINLTPEQELVKLEINFNSEVNKFHNKNPHANPEKLYAIAKELKSKYMNGGKSKKHRVKRSKKKTTRKR